MRSADDLRDLLDKAGLGKLRGELIETDGPTHLLAGGGRSWALFWTFGKAAKRKIINYATIVVPQDGQRLPDQFEDLCGRKVVIIGCGSMGSKIATSLCPVGVSKFVLIVEDIFFPGNAARKASSLCERLTNLAPGADVRTLRISLGGQGSAASMAGALEALGECNVLIDATALLEAFNIIASVATHRKVSLVWAEVCASGIRGLIARARPDWDLSPLAARGQIAPRDRVIEQTFRYVRIETGLDPRRRERASQHVGCDMWGRFLL